MTSISDEASQAGSGTVAGLLPKIDWASTCAGPESSWSQSLRTALNICLDSRFPIVIFWGRDLVLFYNDAYAEILRDKHPAALGQPAQEVWAEIWSSIKPLFDCVVNDGRATYSEDLYLPLETNGVAEERYFTFSYSPIRTESGIGGVFCAVTETTERIMREREAAERAEALAELDRAKTVFFSNVSHEFRTPLTLMLGPLEELLRTADDVQTPLLQSARRNALRLLKLVNTLLQFSALEAGRADAAFEETDLGAVTNDLTSVFRSAIESAGLRLVTAFAPVPNAFVDREMWEKIVLNLLSNALKFTLAGEIGVIVSLNDDAAVLTVSDTGVGIPEEQLPHVFERFHRARSAQARSHEGSGIGLALVDELVRLHGGAITVASTFGEGTTFRVTIPLGTAHLDKSLVKQQQYVGQISSIDQYLAEIQATIETSSTIRVPMEPEPKSDVARILLADDNRDLRDYVTHLLGSDYDVVGVPNGRKALAALRSEPFDLLISDVMMPEMDGLALLQAIREDPMLHALPVIVLTARAGEESSTAGLQSGANDYLVKPFSADQLVTRVRAQLAAARRHDWHIEQQARIARSFQDAALPAALACVPGIHFASLYEPAMINTRVGGDFYDAFRLLDGRLVVSIGDVAGSGVEAAATMGAVRQSIRAAATINPDPQLLLKAADGVFSDSGRPPFASAFVAVVDPLTFSMQYANAGHPPGLLRRPDGSIVPLVENDLLLGLDLETRHGYRRVSSIILEPGSLLALYTDGLTEANHDHEEGEFRLVQAVSAMDTTGATAPYAASAIRDAVLGAGGISHDDVAVLTTYFEQPMLGTKYAPSWTFAWDDGIAAHRARSEMGAILAKGGLSADDRFAADTIFFELVGNAVRHARTPIQVGLDLTQTSPVLNVLDNGPGFSLNPKLPTEVYSERGRGLYIVSQLAREFTASHRTVRGGAHLRAVLPGTLRA
ncbi:MAG: SpoIIE family protein phosphatase [Candidatus Aquilonibacter sp.]